MIFINTVRDPPLLLDGDNYGWHTTLKQAQHQYCVIVNYAVHVYVIEVYYSKTKPTLLWR